MIYSLKLNNVTRLKEIDRPNRASAVNNKIDNNNNNVGDGYGYGDIEKK